MVTRNQVLNSNKNLPTPSMKTKPQVNKLLKLVSLCACTFMWMDGWACGYVCVRAHGCVAGAFACVNAHAPRCIYGTRVHGHVNVQMCMGLNVWPCICSYMGVWVSWVRVRLCAYVGVGALKYVCGVVVWVRLCGLCALLHMWLSSYAWVCIHVRRH